MAVYLCVPLSHAAEHNSSQEKEDNSQSASLHKDDDDDGTHKDWNYEEEKRVEGSKDNIASFHLTQPGSKQKGMRKPNLLKSGRNIEGEVNVRKYFIKVRLTCYLSFM